MKEGKFMQRSVLKNCRVNGEITDIIIEDKKIASVGKTEENGIDVQGKKVYPGLFDIHAHGLCGFDTMDGSEAIAKMSYELAKRGTTSWLPTTMTMGMDTISSVVNTIPESKGTNLLGYHLEGPYISEKHKGAQNSEFIKNPNLDEFHSLSNIKMVTIAPELPGGEEFIANCGCEVALGHTDCDYDTAIKAIEAGASCLTHTFNAMPPIHHRNPGPIGAAIDKNIYVQVICDGIHIHPCIIRMIYKLFGKERMILISDSMRATCLSDGEYDFGGQTIRVKDGVARTLDGAIAGSTSTLMDCVRKAAEFGIPEGDAFYMASRTPSVLMKENKGLISPGYDADLLIVNDDLSLDKVIINGNVPE